MRQDEKPDCLSAAYTKALGKPRTLHCPENNAKDSTDNKHKPCNDYDKSVCHQDIIGRVIIYCIQNPDSNNKKQHNKCCDRSSTQK